MSVSGTPAEERAGRGPAWPRLGGALAVLGAVLAFVAELIYPRAGGDEGKYFLDIAHGGRYPASYLLAGIAAIFVAVGLIALCDELTAGTFANPAATMSSLARRFVPAGLALILAQQWGTAPALRTLARDWVAVPQSNATAAFWSTESIARIDGYLADAWSILLFGIIPSLLAAAMWRGHHGPRPLALVAAVGTVLTTVVALLDLGGSTWDLTVTNTVGALFVIVWLAAVGTLLAMDGLTSNRARLA